MSTDPLSVVLFERVGTGYRYLLEVDGERVSRDAPLGSPAYSACRTLDTLLTQERLSAAQEAQIERSCHDMLMRLEAVPSSRRVVIEEAVADGHRSRAQGAS